MLIDLKTLLELLRENGPAALLAGVFALMWWDERKKTREERKETRKEREEVKMLQAKIIKLTAVVLATVRHERGDDK